MNDDELIKLIASIWRARTDRYSEERWQREQRGKRIEMYQVGG